MSKVALFPVPCEVTMHHVSRRYTLAVCAAATMAVAACAGEDRDAGEPGAGPDAGVAGADPGTSLADGQQAVSLFGEPLFQQEDTTGTIAEADAALAASPNDVELLIEAGRVRRNFWHYRQAMELYGRAMELSPDDWRPYRFRGHRHISVREFDAAIVDLETARELAPMNWDVAYHLGLAYFLAGRFGDAHAEYRRCLDLVDDPAAQGAATEAFRSCSENADDPESFVAMTEWAVRSAARADDDAEVQRLLETVSAGLDVSENVAYYHDLLYYKGEKTADELLDPGPDAPYRMETVGFGVANWMLAQGDTARARTILEALVQDPWWPGFGRIAAEVELYRLTGGG